DANTLVVDVPRPISGPSHGSLTLNADGSFTYTPTAHYNGPDSFTYKPTDGATASNTAMVSITVNPVNDPPDAVNDLATVAEDSSNNVITVLTNDSFAPDAGETLSVTAVGNASHGTTSLVSG